MKFTQNLDITDGTQTVPLFSLVKAKLDEIQSPEELKDFQKHLNWVLMGCLEYVDAVSCSDRQRLIDSHQDRLAHQDQQSKLKE